MKSQHFLIVLGVVGVVVAIWAALRKQGSQPSVIVESNPSLQPWYTPAGQGTSPLGAPPVQPLTADNIPTPVSVQDVRPGTSASGVPTYTAQNQDTGGGAPINAPTPALNRPTFYGGVQTVAGPIMNFINSMIPNQETPMKKSDCGCGGSCGSSKNSCSDCIANCEANNSNYPDGRGGCMAFSRKRQIEQAMSTPTGQVGFARASDNVLSSGVNMFGVYQQTAFDMQNRAMDDGSVPPASPFLSPV
jgi:hypothetical protein